MYILKAVEFLEILFTGKKKKLSIFKTFTNLFCSFTMIFKELFSPHSVLN